MLHGNVLSLRRLRPFRLIERAVVTPVAPVSADCRFASRLGSHLLLNPEGDHHLHPAGVACGDQLPGAWQRINR